MGRQDGEWWIGKIGEKRGHFPANFVTPQQEVDWDGQQKSPIPGAASPVEERVKALYAYGGDNPDDLTFSPNDEIIVLERIDDNWIKGKNVSPGCYNGQIGIFPANFTKPL